MAVVIPTTHAVGAVRRLTAHLRSTLGTSARIVVVDNGPGAARGWDDSADEIVADPSFLGSEVAFQRGLEEAGAVQRYLLLDHDAWISAEDLARMLIAAEAHPEATLSANQGGDRAGWRPSGGTDSGSGGPVTLSAAQWSGMLLPPAAREVVLAQDSQYFISWDDWLTTWRMRQAGIEVLGLPDVLLANQRGQVDAAWRAYYHARNCILFRRDTGQRVRSSSLRALAGTLRRGQPGQAAALLRGKADGMAGRRGMRLPPG